MSEKGIEESGEEKTNTHTNWSHYVWKMWCEERDMEEQIINYNR